MDCRPVQSTCCLSPTDIWDESTASQRLWKGWGMFTKWMGRVSYKYDSHALAYCAMHSESEGYHYKSAMKHTIIDAEPMDNMIHILLCICRPTHIFLLNMFFLFVLYVCISNNPTTLPLDRLLCQRQIAWEQMLKRKMLLWEQRDLQKHIWYHFICWGHFVDLASARAKAWQGQWKNHKHFPFG